MLTVAFQMIHALHDRREVERKARGLPLFSVDGMNDKQDGYQGAQARTNCNLLIGDDLIFPIHLRLRAAAVVVAFIHNIPVQSVNQLKSNTFSHYCSTTSTRATESNDDGQIP